jgi:Ca2+-binding EF-hand superfamily protein
MGNTGSKKGDVLATAAVSKYMNFHREQLLDIRNTCLTLMDKNRKISRVNFQSAVLRARIKDEKVNDILDHLFTMWDLTGEDKVPCMEFILGLSMLACRAESFKSVLRFALQVHDIKSKGKIKAEQLVVVLKSKKMTFL